MLNTERNHTPRYIKGSDGLVLIDKPLKNSICSTSPRKPFGIQSNLNMNLNSVIVPNLRLTEQQTTAGETVVHLRKQESVFSTSQLKRSQTSMTMTAAAKSNIRKDPCFEYFNMMLVA